jgi:hypothetical protein
MKVRQKRSGKKTGMEWRDKAGFMCWIKRMYSSGDGGGGGGI